ncbi:ATP-binding protein [Desulfococcaceae bacterium HSG8]|nr:ATP-binding protein [Desulfococcaceae bacterium HSG8]
MNIHIRQKNPDSTADQQPFLQALAVALVCLVFILLFLIMGIMNLNTLDSILLKFIKNKGMITVKDVQQSAEGYFQQIGQIQQTAFDSGSETVLSEDTVSIQELFLIDLMDLALEIDIKAEEKYLIPDKLISLANEERLSLIAFLDHAGHTIFENRSVPEEIVRVADPVIRGYEAFKISVFDRPENSGGLGFVALRRDSGGTVILGLSDQDFNYRRSRFSIQQAVEATEQSADTAYLVMTDPHDRIIAQSGELPEELRTEAVFKDTVTSRKILTGEENLLEIAAPVRIFDEFVGILRLGVKADITHQILKENRRSMFISVSFMVMVAVLSLWLLHKNQGRYMDRMKTMERQMQQIERLSAMGRLAAGVAHEIRNPLNAISMAIQRLQRDVPHQLTGVIRDEIRRLNQIIEEFLSISRSRNPELRCNDLVLILKQIILLVAEEAQSESIRMITRWPDFPCIVAMDADKMKQAFLNVIKNAMESVPDGGNISLFMKSGGKKQVIIGISDTGMGISAENINHIFDPDYTTKEKGLGLGLPLAWEIIQGHGGEIRVASQPGQGTTFEILLPLDHDP